MVFSPLTEDQIVSIIELSLKGLERRLSEREIILSLTEEGKRFIAKNSYDPAYGARPVKRYLQKNIETAHASKLIQGEITDGDTVVINSDGEQLIFEVK